MKLSWKTAVALVIGGIALGGTLSSFAQDSTEVPDAGPNVTQAHRPGPGGPGGHMGPHKGPGGLVRSETLVEGDEDGTFNTIRVDAGTLKAIDGNTLSIEESDGRTLDVAVTDDTDIRREREEAEVSDLEVGDHVMVHRVAEGDGDLVTKHVMAISAERYAEFEEKRAACEDDDDATECERPERRHHIRGPRGARDAV